MKKRSGEVKGSSVPNASVRRRRAGGVAVLTTAALVAVVAPSTTHASHDADLHSSNMSLVAALPDTGHGEDLAFWGDTAVLTHGLWTGHLADPLPGATSSDEGFVLVDISDPSAPSMIGQYQCAGSGSDVSVWEDLVLLSVVEPMEDASCDATANGPPPFFRGLRIVSIEDPGNPRLITNLNTCADAILDCGSSHRHTIIPDIDHLDPLTGTGDPRLLVYVSGQKQVIVEVPLQRPDQARVIGAVEFAPPRTIFDFGVDGCHDVAVFLPRKLAACTGPRQVQIWDITDPMEPSLMSVIVNPLWALDDDGQLNGAAFSWDGNTLVVGDHDHYPETCADAGTRSPRYALWFYDISEPTLPVLKSHYQLDQPVAGPLLGNLIEPAPSCGVWNFNVVPLRSGRDVLVAAWGRGGTTVVDFTDAAEPSQIAHYRIAPGDPSRQSNPFSSYWYNGFIYVNNGFLDEDGTSIPERGFDVFQLDDPIVDTHVRVNRFNFGTQECLPPPYGAAHGNLSGCGTDEDGGS